MNKSPQSVFVYIYAGSWLGNALLTALAVFLAVQHQGPLDPSTFLVMAACILAGNLLPLFAYALHIRAKRAEGELEHAEADLVVRQALARAEDVTARLDAADGSIAKSILLARQMPERMEAQLKAWNFFVEQFDGEQWPKVSQQLDLQLRDLDFLKDRMAELGEAVEKLPETSAAARAADSTPLEEGDEESISVSEKLDLLAETLDTLGEQSTEALTRLQLLEARMEAQSGESPRRATRQKTAQAEPAAQEELPLTSEAVAAAAESTAEPVRPRSSGLAVVRAHAMIGIQNRLYIRGEGGGLSPDKGREMKLVGIGEYRWTSEPTDEPVRFTLFINDERPCDEGEQQGIPGQIQEIYPHFSS